MKPIHHRSTRRRAALFGSPTRTMTLAMMLALPLSWTLTACQKPAPEAVVPREVVVLPVQADSDTATLNAPAEVQARFVTAMSFRVGGQVVERLVHLGDHVRQGQVVARLDAVDANHNTDSAQADLVSATQHYEAAQRQWQRQVCIYVYLCCDSVFCDSSALCLRLPDLVLLVTFTAMPLAAWH